MTTSNDIRLHIERRILRAELVGGDRLPSVRVLADEHGVAPGTAAAAIRQLADAGLVVTGRGRQGTRVAQRARTELHPQDFPVPQGVVDARLGSPDPALLPPLYEALRLAATDLQNSYTSSLVHPELAAATVAMFAADGVEVDHLVVTNGAMDAVERVLKANNLRVGDRVAVEDPGHVPVHQVVRSAGLVPVPVAVDDYGLDPSSLQQAIGADRVAAVITSPRAQNPTGAALDQDRANELTQVMEGHPEILLIQDDHAGPVAGVPFHQLIPPGPRWATIRSMGKTYGPDLRVALVAGDDDTVARVAYGFSNGPGWVSHILQRAVAHLLSDDTTAAVVEQAATAYQRRRRYLIEALERQGVNAVGRSGFNVWVPVASEVAVVERLRLGGYAVAAGEYWRLESAPAVRVTAAALAPDQADEVAAIIGESQQSGTSVSALT